MVKGDLSVQHVPQAWPANKPSHREDETQKGRSRLSDLGTDPATQHVIWKSLFRQEAGLNRRLLSRTIPRETLKKHKPSGGYSAHSQPVKYQGCLSDLQGPFRTV